MTYGAPTSRPPGFPPSYADLVREHPEVVSGQSDTDPYSNTAAYGDVTSQMSDNDADD